MAEFTRVRISDATKRYFGILSRTLTTSNILKAMVRFFDREGSLIAAHIIRSRLSGGSGLRRRTGSLARSVVGEGFVTNGLPAVRVGVLRGPAVRYAALQEFGTKGKGGLFPTIVPVKAKALAVPQAPALTAAGVDRKGGPRNYPKGQLRFIPFRGRSAVVGGLYSDSELQPGVSLRSITPFYLLLSRVDIAPKRFLRDGFAEELPRMALRLEAFVKALVEGVRVPV